MWYRLAKQLTAAGMGGGVSRSPKTPVAVNPQPVNQEIQKAESWDQMVLQSDHVGNHEGQGNESTGDPLSHDAPNEGPATQGTEMRRLSPYHNNPEHTTLEEQLETTRQQNVNQDPVSMSETNAGKGEMVVRGLPQYNSGKGWNGFNGNLSPTHTYE
jgi:hypothetical protein